MGCYQAQHTLTHPNKPACFAPGWRVTSCRRAQIPKSGLPPRMRASVLPPTRLERAAAFPKVQAGKQIAVGGGPAGKGGMA